MVAEHFASQKLLPQPLVVVILVVAVGRGKKLRQGTHTNESTGSVTYFRATGTACWAGPKRTTRSVYNYAFGPKTVHATRTPPSRCRKYAPADVCTRSVNLCKRPWAYFERLLCTSGAVCPWPVSRPTLSSPKAATAETSAECLWNEGAKLWVDFLRLRHQIVLRCHTSKGEQLSLAACPFARGSLEGTSVLRTLTDSTAHK